MTEHLIRQQQLQRSIERTQENFRKIGRSNLTAAKIRSRIQTLEQMWMRCEIGHATLSGMFSEDDRTSILYFKENHFDRCEDAFNSARDYMADCLEELVPCVSPTNSIAQGQDSPSSAFALSHLPPITLPFFDGGYETWETFRDKFIALIVNNRDLSDFARMHYLMSCLQGRALEYVSSLNVTSDNFHVAWEALVKRFDNKRRLVNLNFSKLLNLSAVTRESAKDLQNLIDSANLAISALNNLNRSPADLWNDILVYIVTQRLDQVTRKAWNMKTGDMDNPLTFADLDQFLGSRARALKEFRFSTVANDNRPAKSTVVSRVNVATVTSTSSAACPLCKAKHYLNICPRFLSKNPTQRQEIVRQFRRCLNCLSRNHVTALCSSKFTCRRCQKRHHTLLHRESASCSPTSNTDQTQSDAASAGEITLQVNACSVSIKTKSRPRVLLATAWVTVSVSTGRSTIVRALIDQGSEMTLISERVAQELRATRVKLPTQISAVEACDVGTYQHAASITISPRDSATPAIPTVAV